MFEAVALNRVYENELDPKELVSPEKSLRISLARTEKHSLSKSVFFCWPNLKDTCSKLARLISHEFPNHDGTGYLLDEALIKACDAYENVAGVAERHTVPMSMYIDKMLEVTAQGLAEWRVHGLTEQGSTAWPAITVPMFDWVKRSRIKTVVFSKRTDPARLQEVEAIKITLMSALLALNDVIIVTRDLER